MGFSRRAFYRVVGWRKAGDQGEGGNDSGTSMALVTGDWNREGEALQCNRFWRGRGGGGEAVPQCWRRTTQRRVAWQPGRPKVVDGVLRLKMIKGNWIGGRMRGWTVDWVMKKYGWKYEMGQKYRRRNTDGTKQKGKKKIKTRKDFLAAENWKVDSNSFWFKNSSKHIKVGSCFFHLVA
jgi:hypothetical protein